MKTTKGWLVTPSEIDETCSKCSIYSQMKTLKIVALYLLPFSCYSLRKFCYKSPFWPSRIATLKMSMHVGWVIFTLRKGVKVCKLLLQVIKNCLSALLLMQSVSKEFKTSKDNVNK